MAAHDEISVEFVRKVVVVDIVGVVKLGLNDAGEDNDWENGEEGCGVKIDWSIWLDWSSCTALRRSA